ncbi:L-aminopeptidase/D-esterase-like protein [Clostridium saccharoperbutylacetonicum]|uniref:Peptidase S58 DmpA n=1 Tax=Clostridium saccharoperbutylacetonicum N1-4(HMT) TaxID=931276 RepID=M1LZW6_9CLOT|nr:P1 family peptidase [Clostridium saccharoperbutylacetonicum]AGF58835.1 peptidase S58 DmpA [Clostridium saccharoperbutylacetonicum N1-4(HMT)]NRT60381.1 L-aminopeptidase/D-esterase-like protein [Clostridium saccharoperbutylacetonicum]NSB23694.1 L-aminopeptidase/D-esterase-like protein [Clostridium saccharoperbutylacetonicum]NSB43065.1 L-aminopeptidase/D-esterase-like protein [Clostridium saccharoperbutylacetonicum]
MKEIKFCDIDGIKLGHAENKEGGTGCSVVICEQGATGGVDVRGGAPGTRETDLLNPMEMVDKIHAVVLSGGSAFGLDASGGVMQYLEGNDIGFDVTVAKVPIVCQAVLFDLSFGDPKVRPDKEMGFKACLNSENYKDNINGNIGAGYGATIGKFLGTDYSMKGGLGTYAIKVGNLEVGAIVAVNCLGDVIDPSNLNIIAGAYDHENNEFLNTERLIIENLENPKNPFKGNTTIGIIVTNADFTKAEANKVASMAHNGYGRTMRPAHTMFDGDTIFTMSTNKVIADVTTVGMLAATVMEKAIIRGVKSAQGLFNIPSCSDINK